MPSTTGTSSRVSARCPTAAPTGCSRRLRPQLADALLERFPVERVEVRVRKPDVVLDPPVEQAAVSVVRERS